MKTFLQLFLIIFIASLINSTQSQLWGTLIAGPYSADAMMCLKYSNHLDVAIVYVNADFTAYTNLDYILATGTLPDIIITP
jgi:putative cell wall-binding protein